VAKTPETRLEKFELLKEHPMIFSLFKKISKREHDLCLEFLKATESLNNDDFALKCNRWYLNEEKPKNYSTMWAIVSQCQINLFKRKRRPNE